MPSDNLLNFTNRDSELKILNRLLSVPAGETLPVVMFYGVGGTGKCWLTKRLIERISSLGIPRAFLDLDSRTGSYVGRHDKAARLAEIRRQLGRSLNCPRFDLAYAWLRAQQGDADDPAFRAGTAIGALREFCGAVLDELPGGSIATWIAEKLSKPIREKLWNSGLRDWLASANGEQHYRVLRNASADDIGVSLHRYLLLDLKEALPQRGPYQCRGVLVLDTIESLSDVNQAVHTQLSAQKWIRDLYHPESPLQIVLAGRDHLKWGAAVGSDFANSRYLEQHLIGGLSEVDAIEFLKKCEIVDPNLQRAILRVCRDSETGQHSAATIDHSPADCHHPWALGLAADSVHNDRRAGLKPEPSAFDFDPDDVERLANRFLQSMGTDLSYEVWLKLLALPPRFDSQAAKNAFAQFPSATVEAAWESLRGYSFVTETEGSGWFRMHSRMRSTLIRLADRMQSSKEDSSRALHAFWLHHWKERSEVDTDALAGLAWYHSYALDPASALVRWSSLAERELSARRMHSHFSLLRWPEAVIAERRQASVEVSLEDASLLVELGNQLSAASLGIRRENLVRAITYFEVALTFFTKGKSPVTWAKIQHNLGVAYADLPAEDRDENASRAVECYEGALSVFNEQDSPTDWAMAQSNLGAVYHTLSKYRQGVYHARAIDCFESALRVYTKLDYPADWARMQHNLGTIHADLRSGNLLENLTRAIAYYQAALTVRTEPEYPAERASTQINLGTALCELRTGDISQNVSQAIVHFEAALKFYTERAFPGTWASTQVCLGNAYRELFTQNQGERVARAINCYQAALRVYTERDHPLEWARTKLNLGTAYRHLRSGDPDQNVAKAISSLRAALRVYTEQTCPIEWAMTQNNLGNAYRQLQTGILSENAKNAFKSYEASLRVRTKQDFPVDWAMTQLNLANALTKLPTGDPDENLTRAISYYQAALIVFSEQHLTLECGKAQQNMGAAYSMLWAGHRRKNLTSAIACYTAALNIFAELKLPAMIEMAKSNLARARKLLSDYDVGHN